MASVAGRTASKPPFSSYELNGAFDQMSEPEGTVREQYRYLHETLLGLPDAELNKRK